MLRKRVLLELDDEALEVALGFTVRQPHGSRIPTLTVPRLKPWLHKQNPPTRVLNENNMLINKQGLKGSLGRRTERVAQAALTVV